MDPGWIRSFAWRGRSVPTYSYALNNPLYFVDPDGRIVWDYSQLSSTRVSNPVSSDFAGERFPSIEERLRKFLKTDTGKKCSEHFKTALGADLGAMLTPNQGPRFVVKHFKLPIGGLFVDKNTADVNAKNCKLDDECTMSKIIHELACRFRKFWPTPFRKFCPP